MKFYDIDDIFTEGKYEGMTLAEVYELDPKYIKRCEEDFDDFYVAPRVMKELKSVARDNAIMNMNLDEMSDDEIAEFLKEEGGDFGFDEEDLRNEGFGEWNDDESEEGVEFEDIDELDLDSEFGEEGPFDEGDFEDENW